MIAELSVVRVHIVEDDPGVNESLRFLLQALGHTVVSHRDAVSFFEATPPDAADMVIVDLGLPNIEGTSVIRWVEQLVHPPRIVAISGQSQRLIDKAVKGFGELTVLRKPLSSESIMPLLV
jgi:FixJ family two-component response regulator